MQTANACLQMLACKCLLAIASMQMFAANASCKCFLVNACLQMLSFKCLLQMLACKCLLANACLQMLACKCLLANA
ncbi:hypothetical protein Tco_0574861, partial [Tanacetum coccineum]